MSVVRINEFQALEARGDDLREQLRSILPTIRQSEGCLSCQLFESEAESLKFIIIETWTSHDAHRLAVIRIPSDELRRTMTLLADVPKGAFYKDIV